MKFARETWADCVDELRPMFVRHWEEIALQKDKVPLDPCYERYEEMDALGALNITTARLDGELVGYMIAVVSPHLHYNSTVMAFHDIYYMKPEHRRGWNGVRLFRAAEQNLKDAGAEQFFVGHKVGLDLGPIFKRLGYSHVETTYAKWIG